MIKSEKKVILSILPIFLLFLLIKKTNCLIHQSCCCYFEKDPFRGFSLKKSAVIEVSYYPFSEKEDISNSFISLCQETRTGFSTYENISRLKDNIHTMDPDLCQKECYNLIKDVTERFISMQESNRDHAALRLKEKKKLYEKDLDVKINENVDNLFNCQYTRNNIIHIPKKKVASRGSSVYAGNRHSVRNSISVNLNGPTQKHSRKSSMVSLDSLPPKKEKNDLDMSFTSFSSTTSELKKDPSMGKKKEDQDPDKNLNLDDIDKLDQTDGVSIKRIIDRLELEISYMKKKNTKPIDFIMNRFSIQDDIMIKIIRIFESTLEEVITYHTNYISESAYFQFRLMDKLKINQMGTGSMIIQNKKF